MGRRLRGYVPIHTPDGPVWYGPGDQVPDDVASMIRDDAWEDEADPVEEEEPAIPALPPPPPPTSGKGSGTDAWVAYADSLGVTVPEDPKRDDVIDAVRAAGHPVE